MNYNKRAGNRPMNMKIKYIQQQSQLSHTSFNEYEYNFSKPCTCGCFCCSR